MVALCVRGGAIGTPFLRWLFFNHGEGGGKLDPPHYYSNPQIFKPSNGPVLKPPQIVLKSKAAIGGRLKSHHFKGAEGALYSGITK